MNINVAKLKQTTAKARETALQNRLDKEKRDRELAAQEKIRQVALANNILERLEETLPKLAKEGQDCYEVYKISQNEYKNSRGNDLLIENITSEKVKHLYNELNKAGLKPEFEYQHDGGGVTSWFMLTVKW